MEKLTLFSDHVLVKREVAERTAGGLWLVGPGDEPSVTSHVVAVGAGKFSPKGVRIPMTVKPGDRVMHGAGAGVPMEYNGEKCLMMHEADLLCVVD
jgi:chaperonin GroES